MASTSSSSQTRFEFEDDPHGAGGFAKVFRGRDNVLERDIAVKVLDPLLGPKFDEADQERFRREAHTLAKLSHPNIPAIYDVSFGDQFLIIFEFIDGLTLRQKIEGLGPISLTDAKRWFGQIAAALQHAHRFGVVHRDVNPNNIIITPDNQSAYLVDFGIALSGHEGHRITESGYLVGTPGYVSPEQQAGEDLDERADVFSLGVTLYEALAAKQIPQGAYETLSIANEAIPTQIDELIQDCFAPKDRRLTSASDFSSRLAGALARDKPMSAVLSDGSLADLSIALEPITPGEFAELPADQRALIFAKVHDIVSSGEEQLIYASAQLLQLLLTRSMVVDAGDYCGIVKPAIAWGFEGPLGDGRGRPELQKAVEEAASLSDSDAHKVLREEFTDFLSDTDPGEKPDWWLHSAREVLSKLLANPACTEGFEELAELLTGVNKAQRSHTSMGRLPPDDSFED